MIHSPLSPVLAGGKPRAAAAAAAALPLKAAKAALGLGGSGKWAKEVGGKGRTGGPPGPPGGGGNLRVSTIDLRSRNLCSFSPGMWTGVRHVRWKEGVRIGVVARPPPLSPVAVDGRLQLGRAAQVLHAAFVRVDVLGVSVRGGGRRLDK